MAVVSVDEVRLLTGLTSNDISDSDLSQIINFATAKLNEDISVTIIRERVTYIDITRKNQINGSNKTFYVKYWKDYYIGDLNDDGVVDGNDIKVYLVSANGTETIATVSSVDDTAGKFVLASAPSAGLRMYITYRITPVRVGANAHSLVKEACAYLAGAMAYSKLDLRKLGAFAIGKLRISKQSPAFSEFYTKYEKTVAKIKKFPFKREEHTPIY